MTTTFTATPRIARFVRRLNELVRGGAPDVERAMVEQFHDITREELAAVAALDMLIDAEIEARMEPANPTPTPGGARH